ncbi:alpha/beta-hydrolase [Mytilinidion resinicola]|uniref:Carboxylic ester hydrolase n=1 Tax=Mytilinidion resinicola TaxID=574789 RepID=A0A6A6YEH4_9PEZI|nr:alpha/beta-hydrolase [Mytilinidion resinicola]KAF2807221.1 alpha/beta-hydrolase [Mytilinidion resinicola]
MRVRMAFSRSFKLDLASLGVIEGISYVDPNTTSRVLCRYIGGLPYALPPVGPYRFKRPRPLPECYRYGTHANPGRFTGGCGVCPQPKEDPERWEEDCLQVNIWMPAGNPPEEGWPVLFFIHGGFLQWGTPNEGDHIAMLEETNFNAIIVKPAYRVNLFGFLASEELLAESPENPDLNVGFWDQRLALEWTYQNINHFGGNPKNITIAGYSAGAHSVFHQVSHELYYPFEPDKSIIRRAFMWSNGPGLQPHTLLERQQQFDELLSQLNIDKGLPPPQKMSLLRNLDVKTLQAANERMVLHEFRAVTDESFLASNLFANISNGDFARRMLAHKLELITGECRDEHFVYGAWRPPQSLTYRGVFDRLRADYPLAAVKVLMNLYSPDGQLPQLYEDWGDAFGHIYADMQIHDMERGFVDCLTHHGAGNLLKRYRVEWRAKCCEIDYPKEWGVTHGTDTAIWFWGEGMGPGLRDAEKPIVRNFVFNAMTDFVHGKEINQKWNTKETKEARRLKSNGEVDIWQDERWERGVELWQRLSDAGCLGHPT